MEDARGTDTLHTPLLSPLTVRNAQETQSLSQLSEWKEWEEFYAFTLWLGSCPENFPIPQLHITPAPLYLSSLSSLQASSPSPLESPPAPTVSPDLGGY